MLTMLLTGASLSGCIMNFRGSGYNYNGADKYRVFDGAVQGDFTKLDIGWISGDVTVVRGDSFGITEIIDGNDAPEYRMHYRFDGKTLKIRYAASGTKLILPSPASVPSTLFKSLAEPSFLTSPPI